MKTNGIRKALAILLCVLLATPLFVLPTFADGEVFNQIYVWSSSCESGQTWYNCRELAKAKENDAYKSATYYLSEDGNTLKIVYTVDEETVTELHERDTEPEYFAYFYVVPEFGEALPTSPDGLSDGDYWFDVDGLAALMQSAGLSESLLYIYTDATYHLSVDGTMLRKRLRMSETYVMNDDEFLDNPSIMSGFLHQIGIDPNAGFTLLPTSEDGLEDGTYWFDLAAFSENLSEDSKAFYQSAEYYLSDDGNTLRIFVAGQKLDFDREEDAYFFVYLRQAGVDPNAGFTLLPTSDEGLEDGDYWYDAAGFAALTGSDEYLTYQYYLSDDANTLRIVMSGYTSDVTRDKEYAGMYFGYLHQVGVDPNAGFTLLPKSPEGLNDGDYWYDAAGLAAAEGEATLADADYYLSDDGATIRLYLSGYMTDYSSGTEVGALLFGYLYVVGQDPNVGFTLLPKSADGLEVGDYWFDAAGFAAAEGEATIEDAFFYLSDDGATIRILYEGQRYDYAVESEEGALFLPFLHQVEAVDPYAGFTLLPTSAEGLSDGDYWYDAANLADFAEDAGFLTMQYYLSDDGEMLRIFASNDTHDVTRDSVDADIFFAYLLQVGVDPDAGFAALPVTDEGLNEGDYWYDAAGLAAEEQNEMFLTAGYYLSADGTTLRIRYKGFPFDFTADTQEGAEYFAYLHQVEAISDPNAGFTLLPTSDEGLSDGDYWYDAASLAAAAGEQAFLTARFYISDDGETLRIIAGNDPAEDLTRDSMETRVYFFFLHQVGVDPNAGFDRLPTSAEGLEIGDYWYDAAGLASEEGDDSFLNAEYYLSADGGMLRVYVPEYAYAIDVTAADGKDGETLFSFLRQVEPDPDTVYMTMTASTDVAYVGNTVEVTVDLTHNPGLAGMALSLQFDAAALTLTQVQTQGMLLLGNVTLGGDLTAQPFNVLWDDATATENHTETGVILILTFTVKDDAAAGETAITLTNDADSTFDVDLQNVPMQIAGTSLKILDHLAGDVDGDGEVDLVDVAVLTRYLAGGWDVTIDERCSDVNGDGILDLKDVVLIRRFLAGGWDVELV